MTNVKTSNPPPLPPLAAKWLASAAEPHRRAAEQHRAEAEAAEAEAKRLSRKRTLDRASGGASNGTEYAIKQQQTAAETSRLQSERATFIADRLAALAANPALVEKLTEGERHHANLTAAVRAVDERLLESVHLLAAVETANLGLFTLTQNSDVSHAFEKTSASLAALMAHRSGADPFKRTWELPDRGADPAGHVAIVGGYDLAWSPELIAKGVVTSFVRDALHAAAQAFENGEIENA